MPLKSQSKTKFILFILLYGILLFITACSEKGKTGADSIIGRDTVPYPQISALADLPESNQPRQIELDTMPQPLVITVPVKYSAGHVAKNTVGTGTLPLVPPVTHYLVDTATKIPVPPDAQGKGLFTTYTTDDGISLDEIYCGLKDKNGNLWFGTNGGGISRYDGKSFSNYTTANGLPYNLIWCILQDRHGNIWVGTDGGGISKYDGARFTNYSTVQGLAHDVVNSITEDKAGNLWFGTKGGISKFDGRHFTNYTMAQGLGNNAVSDIEEDGQGNLWIATRGGGVSKFDGRVFSNFTTNEGLANNNVRSVLTDRNGNLWFATSGGGVSKFDGKYFNNYSVAQGLSDDTVWTITQDKTGYLWFGTNKGVSKYDGKVFTDYTTDQGLANNKVKSITEDEKGNIWFGTFGGGISKFAGQSITNFTTTQGLANNVVYSIVEDSTGNLWFATNGGGVSRYDGRSFTNYTTSQGLATNEVYSMAKDRKGNLWFGNSGGGVSKYDGKKITHYTTAQGLANNTVFRIVEDKNGNLWFGTSGGGVSKFDGRRFTNFTTRQGLANNVVFSMIEDRNGNFWFGTLGGGVSKFDGRRFTNFTMAQGLADNGIWAITEDKSGDLWFGTQNGLSLLRLNKLQKFTADIEKKQVYTEQLFESFTTREGLPNNFISQIIQGNDQKLYIGTNMGMCELLSAKTDSASENNWVAGKTFNSNSGYPVKDVNSGPGAMFIDSKGIIWIGTGSDKTGLVRFNPAVAGSEVPMPPRVVIKSIRINNENICWSDLAPEKKNGDSDSIHSSEKTSEEVGTFGRLLSDPERDSMRLKFGNITFNGVRKWYPVPEKLVLPHENNDISFDFNAIETGKNFLVRYQYMLEGYDNRWSPPGNKTSASFGHIYEGRYVFRLKAQSPEGVWSEPETYSFEVCPPWWRTWWAYSVYALMFLWALRSFSKFRERRLRFEKEKLELKVKHRTQLLEDTIETLKNTQTQLIQSEKMASLGELTAGIAHEIQNPLNFVNNFSEVNKELLGDMHLEIEKGNMPEIREIAKDLMQNTEKINQHGKRADSIVKGMLQHSRASAGHKEPSDINALADEFLKLAYHGMRAKDKDFSAELETHFDHSIGKINIIPQEIGRVLLNIYNNAFYAVADRKKQSKEPYVPLVSIHTRKLGDKIELSVKDNGMGIPEKVKEKIFQPFFTTKPAGQGTGLGLSLSYDIVKAHQGSMDVHSKEGEFTEFVIHLPE